MDWGHLFFGFSGRTSRAKFWIAALIYVVIDAVLTILGYVANQNAVFQAVSGMLSIVVLISSIAVVVKRLHDRDRSGWYLVLFYIVPTVLVVGGVVASVTMEESTLIVSILGLLAFAVGVWAFVELGCLRGTIGANQYGPDPVVTVPPVRMPPEI